MNPHVSVLDGFAQDQHPPRQPPRVAPAVARQQALPSTRSDATLALVDALRAPPPAPLAVPPARHLHD